MLYDDEVWWNKQKEHPWRLGGSRRICGVWACPKTKYSLGINLLLLRLAPLWVRSTTGRQQPPEWSVLGQVDCFGPWQPVGVKVVLHRLHPGHLRSSWWSLPIHRRRESQDLLCVYIVVHLGICPNRVRRRAWIISVSLMLVGLALNFIVGDEVIPLDVNKHTETPLMEGIDPACVFLGNRPALWPIQENRQYTCVVEPQLSWQPDSRPPEE